MTQPQTQATRPTTSYIKDDLVMFRDVDRFWLGLPATPPSAGWSGPGRTPTPTRSPTT
jgi:hypothetical protein